MKKLFLFILLAISFLLDGSSSGGTVGFLVDKASKAFVEFKNTQEFNDPELTGPDRLCNIFGSVLGTYSGGGDPETDVYQWTILDPQGQILFTRPAGAFPTITYTFELVGTHKVELIVSRGGIPLESFSKEVELVEGPEITLKPSYVICENQEIQLQAIDPSSSNFPDYEFEWKDESGVVVGTSNSLKTSASGKYEVTFLFKDSGGNPECETRLQTEVISAGSFSIVSSSTTVCPDGTITFTSEPEVDGDWFLQKIGDPVLTPLGSGNSKTISPGSDLDGHGDYEVSLVVPNPNNVACIQKAQQQFSFNPLPEFELESAASATGCLVPDGAIRIVALTPIDFLILDEVGQSFGPLNPGDIVEFPGLESGTYTILGQLGGCLNSLGSVVPLVDPPAQLEFEISDIQSEYCTETGKENGSFLVKLISGILEGSYRIKNLKGSVVKNEPLPLTDEFRIDIQGGKYFFEILDKDSCNLPKSEEFEVPSLDQVNFSISDNLSICQSYEFTPQTSEALEFTLTFPDDTEAVLPAGEAFVLTQAGTHTLVGRLPGQAELCPTLKEFTVKLVDPIVFEPRLMSEDCTVGNRIYKAEIFEVDPSTAVFQWKNETGEVVGTGQFLFLPPSSFGEFSLEVQPAESQTCPISPTKFIVKKPVLSVDVTLESTKLCEYGPRALVDLTTTFPEEITDIEWRRYDDMGNIEPLPQFNNQWQITADIAGIYEVAVFSRIPSINKDCELGRQTLDIDLIPEKVPFDVPSDLFICDPFSLVPESATPLAFELTFPDGKIEVKDWNEAFILDQEGSYTLLGYDPNIKGPLCPDEKTIQVKVFEPVQFVPKLVDMSCTGEYHYTAEIINYPPDEVDYLWKDPSGNLVSSTSELFSTTYGAFTLEIQPTGSIPCTVTPTSIILEVPALSITASIVAETLCPDQPDAALRLETDFGLVATIEWWFTDLSSNQSMLSSETGKREILATNEGTYQVRIFNEFNCLLGSDETFVARSTDAVRPKLEESYQICPKYEIAPTLNPGSFAQYEWYFEDNLVSTNPTFKPLQIGTYYLIVVSQEGCAYETSFETTEECDLEVVFPNAIQPGNPDKQFLTYANFLVDEMEIWIFSKWGNLIFHCFQVNSAPGESACFWDGTFDGKAIPPGSYAVRINSRNIEKNLKNEQWEAILVVD
ncbi:hypothetical protein [Algoriphagus terrigena]|uniref:hypothetical protein n=1 Tax=Algoriphagus terrigena TaxID=344884 RepID=UPI00047AFE45|nr:hypothetical protein [Algoriphagus terrigena]